MLHKIRSKKLNIAGPDLTKDPNSLHDLVKKLMKKFQRLVHLREINILQTLKMLKSYQSNILRCLLLLTLTTSVIIHDIFAEPVEDAAAALINSATVIYV